MLFPNRPVNWDNRDYRVYRDNRTRQKRRLRLRMFIGLGVAMIVGILLAAAWLSTINDQHRADAAPAIISQAGSAGGSGGYETRLKSECQQVI